MCFLHLQHLPSQILGLGLQARLQIRQQLVVAILCFALVVDSPSERRLSQFAQLRLQAVLFQRNLFALFTLASFAIHSLGQLLANGLTLLLQSG